MYNASANPSYFTGDIELKGNLIFPDGTVQTTAAGGAGVGIFNIGINNPGLCATELGCNNHAHGEYSTAMGQSTATGYSSTAIGFNATATGYRSVAIGSYNLASGFVSTAIGYGTYALGYGSVAIGMETQAKGKLSTSFGYRTTAPSYVETVIGQYETTYSPIAGAYWESTDRLFVIGNGTGLYK